MTPGWTRRGVLALALLPLACSELYDDEVPARFEVAGGSMFMTGTINSGTPRDLARALDANPQVTEIVMVEVPGSANDAANLRAARMVRAAGLTTRLRADSLIASGGIDFFLGGRRRIVAPGAQIGVHSWSTLGGEVGADMPVGARAHRDYLDFYRDMGIPEDFYWFTLQSAPPEDLHWLTPSEIRRYGLATG